jgi:hypothetical protein
MGDLKTYSGGCHCGKVRYEVTTDLARIISCNCSHCAIKGLQLNFVPAAQFQLLRGEGELGEYLFNKKVIHHLFCKTCGVQSFATGTARDGSKMFSVNVRCLDDLDPSQVTLTPFDGKSR